MKGVAFRRLRPVQGSECFLQDEAFGMFTFGTRAEAEAGSVLYPIGDGVLEVPFGVLLLRDVVEYQGRHYRVTGVSPVGMYSTTEEATLEVVTGTFLIADALLDSDGNVVVDSDGSPLVTC